MFLQHKLQHKLDEAVRAKMEAEAMSQAKADAETMTEEETAELQQLLENERTRNTELQRLLEFEMTVDCASCGRLQEVYMSMPCVLFLRAWIRTPQLCIVHAQQTIIQMPKHIFVRLSYAYLCTG